MRETMVLGLEMAVVGVIPLSPYLEIIVVIIIVIVIVIVVIIIVIVVIIIITIIIMECKHRATIKAL